MRRRGPSSLGKHRLEMEKEVEEKSAGWTKGEWLQRRGQHGSGPWRAFHCNSVVALL